MTSSSSSSSALTTTVEEGDDDEIKDLSVFAAWFLFDPSGMDSSSSTRFCKFVDVEADGRMMISSRFSMMSTEIIDSPNISAETMTGSWHSGRRSGRFPMTSLSKREFSAFFDEQGEELISR